MSYEDEYEVEEEDVVGEDELDLLADHDDLDELDVDDGSDEVLDDSEEDDAVAVSWKARREELVKPVPSVRRGGRVTWEEQFDDDPLRGEAPTRDLERPIDPYSSRFVAIARITSAEQLRLRQEAWVHHMQWARRSALVPGLPATVAWEYTQLTQDSMAPTGQVLCVKANSSGEVLNLLESEPLAAHGGVSAWRLFEYWAADEEELAADLRQPYLFLGLAQSKKLDDEVLAEQRTHHILQNSESEGRRVAELGRLREVGGTATGALLLLSAVSNKDAQRYMGEDPVFKRGAFSELVLIRLTVACAIL
jgi:uncharacterized protein YciI